MMAGCISWLLVVLTTFHMVAAARADPMPFCGEHNRGKPLLLMGAGHR